jgi:hypothetical protein
MDAARMPAQRGVSALPQLYCLHLCLQVAATPRRACCPAAGSRLRQTRVRPPGSSSCALAPASLWACWLQCWRAPLEVRGWGRRAAGQHTCGSAAHCPGAPHPPPPPLPLCACRPHPGSHGRGPPRDARPPVRALDGAGGSAGGAAGLRVAHEQRAQRRELCAGRRREGRVSSPASALAGLCCSRTAAGSRCSTA